jgi:hypothetical protein
MEGRLGSAAGFHDRRMTDDGDAAVRLRAFAFLTDQRRRFGEASIPRTILERGFDFEGVRVPLIGPQGILALREVVWVNPGTFGYDGTVRLPAACR